MKKITIVLWFFTILGLFFYSFTQVDLNLTLIRHPLFNQIVKSFQYIGYFQRPLSTYLYLLLLFSLFLLYFSFLALAKKGNLSRREFWLVIICTSVILLFSYPAFSYDIFNYMFDAKTIVFYHANPWQYRPLYFVGDPWLHFMHWTHRPSIYPPVWIGLSLPFYWLGFNFFLPILFNFKVLMTAGFLGSIFVLEKLLLSTSSVILGSPKGDTRIKKGFWTSQNDERQVLTALVFYAFSPLMLIENLVSGHNDIVMMFLGLVAIYFLLNNKKLWSWLFLIISVLIKYVTIVLIPAFLYFVILGSEATPESVKRRFWASQNDGNKINSIILYRLSLILVFAGFCFLVARIDIQPWYLVWLMPFVVLSRWKIIWPAAIGLMFGLLLRYAPFLFLGNWNKPVPTYEFWLTLVPLLIALLLTPLLMRRKII